MGQNCRTVDEKRFATTRMSVVQRGSARQTKGEILPSTPTFSRERQIRGWHMQAREPLARMLHTRWFWIFWGHDAL